MSYVYTCFDEFVFSENKIDGSDNYVKAIKSLYAKANGITRMFHYCTVDVKLLLIKSSLYFFLLWISVV